MTRLSEKALEKMIEARRQKSNIEMRRKTGTTLHAAAASGMGLSLTPGSVKIVDQELRYARAIDEMIEVAVAKEVRDKFADRSHQTPEGPPYALEGEVDDRGEYWGTDAKGRLLVSPYALRWAILMAAFVFAGVVAAGVHELGSILEAVGAWLGLGS